MKGHLLIAAALLTAASVPAQAADIATPAPVFTRAPVMESVYGWTGPYFGLNAGGARGDSEVSTTTVFSAVGDVNITASSVSAIAAAGARTINPTGFTGGGQLGYNWQFGSIIVLGLEADLEYFGLKGSSTVTTATFTISQSVKTDWLATLRPRAGFLILPGTLFYVTGGIAFTNLQGNFAFSDIFTATESATFTSTKLGWTIGGGIEWAIWGSWSAKAEYLFASFPAATVTSTNLTAATPPGAFPSNVFTHSADLDVNVVRFGLNYRFGSPMVAKY